MKKLMTALAVVLFLSLAMGIVFGPAGGLFLPAKGSASFGIEIPLIPLPEIPIIDKPIFTPKPTISIIDIPVFTLKPIPSVSLRPTLKPDLPPPTPGATPAPVPNDKPTNRPSAGRGQLMNNEGPLFLSFRADLTDELLMFTPMDLSLEGEFRFPLIGNASQVVGEAKVVIQSGMVTVTYLVVSGVNVDVKNEFFTFFTDIRSVPSVEPRKLQDVKLKFGIPYSIQSWLGSDPNVLLYINTPVTYKTNLTGLTSFSFQDLGYLERMMKLLPLMD